MRFTILFLVAFSVSPCYAGSITRCQNYADSIQKHSHDLEFTVSEYHKYRSMIASNPTDREARNWTDTEIDVMENGVLPQLISAIDSARADRCFGASYLDSVESWASQTASGLRKSHLELRFR